MSPLAWSVVNDLPRADTWDFGGFPYGLEPLTLPPAGADGVTDPAAHEAPLPAGYGDACARLRAIGRPPGPPLQETVAPPTEVSWFRWITGHQVSFVLWHLMARAIGTASGVGGEPDSLPGELAHYVRACGGMLLYAGSCPREVYEVAIRSSMYLQHRAFSGSWAPDFLPVRDLFRERLVLRVAPEDDGGLRHAIRLFHSVHTGVAAKLVPHDRSLLQRSGAERPCGDRQLRATIYDNYFLTLRSPVPFADVVAQLLRRLNAIAHDLATNGLELGADDSVPESMLAGDVCDLGRDLVPVCAAVAELAAGRVRHGAGASVGHERRPGLQRQATAARG